MDSFTNYIFKNPRMASFWLLVRLYVGFTWLQAGIEKFNNPAWVGDNAGAAMKGFVGGALSKTTGAHPDVSMWYAWFLENLVLPYAEVWSYMVPVGQVLVALGLIFGVFVGLAAFFGAFMNLNFLWAGTVSTNPTLLVLGIGIILARKVAGRYGLDIYIKPRLKKIFS